MLTVHDTLTFLGEFAPLELAEDWDNVGLLIGETRRPVERLMTCLTLTPDVADEAISHRAELIITHHPVLFRAIQRLTDETPDGEMLLRLIGSGIAVYCPHTAFDSAREGINASLAESLGLEDVAPLRPAVLPDSDAGHSPAGGGRHGRLASPMRLDDFLSLAKVSLGTPHLQFVGESAQIIERVGVACGAAAEFLPDARAAGCQALLTGEARFHACLEARANGMALILAGHYATERPAVESLASRLARQFPQLTVWASQTERDPLQWSPE